MTFQAVLPLCPKSLGYCACGSDTWASWARSGAAVKPQHHQWAPQGPPWPTFKHVKSMGIQSGSLASLWALVGPCWPPGRLWAEPLWAPWALVGRALVGPLGACGPGPCGRPGPLWALWALVGRALVGPLSPLMKWILHSLSNILLSRAQRT